MNAHSQVQVPQVGNPYAKDDLIRAYSLPNTGVLHATNLRSSTQTVDTRTPPSAAPSTLEQNVRSLDASIQSPIDQDTICGIMQKQNEITSRLLQQQVSATLPQREMSIFDGDPLQCMYFIRTFEHCVEAKAGTYQDCLYYLEQYTRGQPRELVRSCLHMTPQQGYERAKELLIEHFGNEYTIATAYMDKAFGWPAIKTDDVKALQEFALFLRGCCNAMMEIQYMEEMDIPSNMRQVMMKWPYKLRERWRAKAFGIQEQQGYRATFLDMVSFLENQVKMLSHPLFGDISEARPNTSSQPASRSRPPPRSHISESSFVTNTSATNHTVTSELTTPSTSKESCLYCGEVHPLSRCSELSKISQMEKIGFLKAKGVCFGCLKAGHMNKECRSRLSCDECHQNHPTVLHNQDETPEIPVSSALVSLQAYGYTGAGGQDCTLPIVPVKLKSTKGGKVLQTYALLDPGSTATFCSTGHKGQCFLAYYGARKNC